MRGKRLLVGLGVVIASAVVAGVALAVWSATGSGSGGAAATVAQNLVVTAVTPSGSAARLYPGGPAGPVYLTIQNPNPYAVTITGYTWGTPLSTNTTTCANSNIALDAGAPTTANLSIAANGTLTGVQINGVLDLAHSAPNGCQGVGFTAPVTLTGTQQ